FFSSRRRHTRSKRDWSSDVCSSDLVKLLAVDYRLVLTEDEKILWNRLLPSDPHIRPEQWQATQLPWRQELPVWKYCKQMGFMKSLNNSANVWKRVSWKKQSSTAFLLLLIDYKVH